VNTSDQLMHEVVVRNIYEGNMEGLRGLAATCGRAVGRPALHGSSHWRQRWMNKTRNILFAMEIQAFYSCRTLLPFLQH